LKKNHLIFLNSILSSSKTSDPSLNFYNFQRGYESVLGYSEDYKIQSISSFSFYYDRYFPLFVDKYLDYFLFNHTNIIYRYYNDTENNSNFFLEIRKFHHSTNFEFVCASFPTLIILLILIPSTLLLYSLDEELQPEFTYKVLGHQ